MSKSKWLVSLVVGSIFLPVVFAASDDLTDHPGYVDFSSLTALANGEPTVEVRKRDMEKTVKLFEEKGFVKEEEGAHLFTRFALMRKRIS